MIVRNNKEVYDVYRGSRYIKAIYRGDHLIWKPYLKVDKEVMWVSPQDIESLLIQSNRQRWDID